MSQSLFENFEPQFNIHNSSFVFLQYDVEPTSPLFIPINSDYLIEDSIFNFQPVPDDFLEYAPLPVIQTIPQQPQVIENRNNNFPYQISMENFRFRRPMEPAPHKSTKAEIRQCIKRKVQSKKYTKCKKAENHDENEKNQCCICLNEFKCNRPIGVLKCGHQFHKTCITKWINKKFACPLCRYNILQ